MNQAGGVNHVSGEDKKNGVKVTKTSSVNHVDQMSSVDQVSGINENR
jgi:hypothetical protein